MVYSYHLPVQDKENRKFIPFSQNTMICSSPEYLRGKRKIFLKTYYLLYEKKSRTVSRRTMETKCIPKVFEYIMEAANAVTANKQNIVIKGIIAPGKNKVIQFYLSPLNIAQKPWLPHV
jgi:hypothetical protein